MVREHGSIKYLPPQHVNFFQLKICPPKKITIVDLPHQKKTIVDLPPRKKTIVDLPPPPKKINCRSTPPRKVRGAGVKLIPIFLIVNVNIIGISIKSRRVFFK